MWGPSCLSASPRIISCTPVLSSFTICLPQKKIMISATGMSGAGQDGVGGVETLLGGGGETVLGLNRPQEPRIHQDSEMSQLQARWVLFFSCSSFTLSYRPGFRNVKPVDSSRQFICYTSSSVSRDTEVSATIPSEYGAAFWSGCDTPEFVLHTCPPH